MSFGNDTNVLIIEEDEQMQKLLISTFLRLGMDVTLFEDGQNALNFVEENEWYFDLVLVNFNLISNNNSNSNNNISNNNSAKKISAFEICKQLRSKFSKFQLPILIKLPQLNSQYITQSLEMGCNDFIQIPFNNSEFSIKVRNLIEIKKIFAQKKRLESLIDLRTQIFKMNTHDLKNPLSSIFSLSGISIDSFKDNEELSQTFKVIHDASKIMTTLVNQTLEFVTISSEKIKFEKEMVDVVGLVNQIVEINTPLAKEKNQQIIVDYPCEDCIIFSDTGKIYQAVNNVVGNSIKFSPFNKKIWISVKKDTIFNKVQIIVKDEGPGFKKDEVNDVLTKFGKHSATPTGNEISTGLGLLITKQIINLIDGEIYLESEEGKGATFTFEFKTDNYNELEY
jgi:two-component system sensor histidine kinase/response regulator